MMVALDLTDPLNDQQAERLQKEIKRLIKAMEEGTLIAVGIVHPKTAEQGEKMSVCKPPSEANPLYQNSQMIEERYRKQFEVPLNRTIQSMMIADEQPSSPIIESITSLVASAEGVRGSDAPKTLILVSDLMQNSNTMSFYKGHKWDDFRRTPAFDNLSRILKDFHIHIIRIPRTVPQSIDPIDVDNFWKRYLEAHSVRSLRLDRATLGEI